MDQLNAVFFLVCAEGFVNFRNFLSTRFILIHENDVKT